MRLWYRHLCAHYVTGVMRKRARVSKGMTVLIMGPNAITGGMQWYSEGFGTGLCVLVMLE